MMEDVGMSEVITEKLGYIFDCGALTVQIAAQAVHADGEWTRAEDLRVEFSRFQALRDDVLSLIAAEIRKARAQGRIEGMEAAKAVVQEPQYIDDLIDEERAKL